MLVAINDEVDTSKDDDDFVPFRNIMNEWYAKDTNQKIKSVFQAKGRSGKHVASSPPYGYLKSKEDPNQWIVDEEAAEVIRRIYRMAVEGLGPLIGDWIVTSISTANTQLSDFIHSRFGTY